MAKTPHGPAFRTHCLYALIGILTIIPRVVTAAPVTIPYVETFNAGTSSFSGGSSWSHVFQNYHATVGSGATSGSSVQAPAFPAGFRMEATISGLTGATGDNSVGFGFLGADATFSGGAAAPYYLADIKTGSNKIRLVQVAATNTFFIDGEALAFTLNSSQPFKLGVEGTYDGPVLRLKVTVSQGSSQSVHVFDEDTPLTGSYFGFRVRSASGAVAADYDDFSLRNVTAVKFTDSLGPFARAGLPYSSTITAATTGAGPISISALQLPPWLSFTDNGNGTATVSGTPPAGTTGSSTMKIQADDGNSTPAVEDFPLKLLGISGVVISEFVASSDGAYLDEDGDESDWLEIFNADATPADIGGWKLKDDQTSWTIPQNMVLPAFGHLVVFASDKNRIAPNLHTNFKLSASAGGYLALVRPDNSIASEYASYPAQRKGASYGLYGDYTSRGILIPTTASAANPSVGYTDFAPPPTYSATRGFFDTPQSITLASTLPGGTLAYTLDGSEPSPTNGTIINSGSPTEAPSTLLAVNATTTVRAAVFKEGYVPSGSLTETYIFLSDVVSQSANGLPPPGWPTGSVNGQKLDYGMDPEVINTPAKADELKTALKSLPHVLHRHGPQTSLRSAHRHLCERLWEGEGMGAPGFDGDDPSGWHQRLPDQLWHPHARWCEPG